MLQDKEVILGASLFILMLSIENNKYAGKRLVKKANRSIKKELAITRKSNTERYLKLVYIAHVVLERAKKEVRLLGMENEIITPGEMLAILAFRYGDMFNSFKVDTEVVSELNSDKYKLTGHGFFTVKYTNILMEHIDRLTDEFIENFDYKKAEAKIKEEI